MSLEGMLHSNQEIRGRISGMSVVHTDAYEIALRNGFEGTVEEWLASLKGEKGDSSVGADWNAAEGEPGHIKNRTHWDDFEDITFAEYKTVNKTGYTTVSWLTYDKVKDCTTARVIFNGVEYVCPVTVKINFTEYGDESYFYIGNFQDGAPQYPFCFFGYIGKYFAIVNAEEGTHTVSVYGRKEVVHKLPEKYLPDYIKTVNGIAPDESGNVEVAGGLNETARALLIAILRNAVYTSDQSANITALENALASNTGGGEVPDIPDEPNNPEVTLVSIAATYSGGDVAVGTAVTALTGIVVTAHYSDGSTAKVTGYTLSGTIAEGSNTITVTYEGKTATFTVTGVAESGGDSTDITSFIVQEDYLKDSKAYWDACGVYHNQEYDYNSKSGALYVANTDFSALSDYFNSDYATLYGVAYFPNRTDEYGHFNGNIKIAKNISYGVTTNIATAKTAGVRGETEDYKIFYVKLTKADIVSAVEATEYTLTDVNEIVFEMSNTGVKNQGIRGVWMTTEPTAEQCIAIRDFFANGGEL